MVTGTTTAKTVQQAQRHARCFDKAKGMSAEGYRVVLVCFDRYDVYAPDEFAWPYTVYLPESTCTCPDWEKHKDGVCKHVLYASLMKEEQANEAASMEAQCREWEEFNFLDLIPTPTPVTIAIKDIRRAWEAELTTVQAAIQQHGPRRSNYIQCQQEHDRAGRLEGALILLSQTKL